MTEKIEVEKLSGVSVLIVEDEPAIQTYIRMTLENAGAKTMLAKNGFDAIHLFKTNNFHAIVSDLNMPGGHGDDFMATLSAVQTHPPVIFVTGDSSKERHNKVYLSGAAAVLKKPINSIILIDIVARCVKKKWM